jgi:hypothetical protein
MQEGAGIRQQKQCANTTAAKANTRMTWFGIRLQPIKITVVIALPSPRPSALLAPQWRAVLEVRHQLPCKCTVAGEWDTSRTTLVIIQHVELHGDSISKAREAWSKWGNMSHVTATWVQSPLGPFPCTYRTAARPRPHE